MILTQQVPFYQQLNAARKKEFEDRVQQFLEKVKITGIKTTVEDIDRVLIAASAVIIIFNFHGWEYVTLHEVLLYPGSFDHEFEQPASGRQAGRRRPEYIGYGRQRSPQSCDDIIAG